MSAPIRIGSRGSQLALWQANHILSALQEAGHPAEIEIIRTTGDRMQQPGFVAPSGLDGKGVFTKEIEDALEEGRIDLAVHSLKDLPTELASQFVLGAIPARADARDAFVCEPYWALHTLPYGARIGTTSPRRKAQLLALRPDLSFVEVRGNIDTRLRKLETGEADALVLAAAGLDRLGRNEWVHQRFSAEEMCPAPGQGALAIEIRAKACTQDPDRDAYIRAAVEALDCAETRFCVDAERTVLQALGGGCQLPVGAFCARSESTPHHYRLHAQVVAPDGERMIHLTHEAPMGVSPVSFGEQMARELQDRGAVELLSVS